MEEQDEIKRLARQYMAIWNAGGEDALDRLASYDILISYTHFERPYEGIADYKEMLRTTHDFFPDMVIAIQDIFPSDLAATVYWSYSGTHKSGNLFGAEATGKLVTVPGVTTLTFHQGFVKEERGIVDNLSLILQLGLLS